MSPTAYKSAEKSPHFPEPRDYLSTPGDSELLGNRRLSSGSNRSSGESDRRQNLGISIPSPGSAAGSPSRHDPLDNSSGDNKESPVQDVPRKKSLTEIIEQQKPKGIRLKKAAPSPDPVPASADEASKEDGKDSTPDVEKGSSQTVEAADETSKEDEKGTTSDVKKVSSETFEAGGEKQHRSESESAGHDDKAEVPDTPAKLQHCRPLPSASPKKLSTQEQRESSAAMDISYDTPPKPATSPEPMEVDTVEMDTPTKLIPSLSDEKNAEKGEEPVPMDIDRSAKGGALDVAVPMEPTVSRAEARGSAKLDTGKPISTPENTTVDKGMNIVDDSKSKGPMENVTKHQFVVPLLPHKREERGDVLPLSSTSQYLGAQDQSGRNVSRRTSNGKTRGRKPKDSPSATPSDETERSGVKKRKGSEGLARRTSKVAAQTSTPLVTPTTLSYAIASVSSLPTQQKPSEMIVMLPQAPPVLIAGHKKRFNDEDVYDELESPATSPNVSPVAVSVADSIPIPANPPAIPLKIDTLAPTQRRKPSSASSSSSSANTHRRSYSGPVALESANEEYSAYKRRASLSAKPFIPSPLTPMGYPQSGTTSVRPEVSYRPTGSAERPPLPPQMRPQIVQTAPPSYPGVIHGRPQIPLTDPRVPQQQPSGHQQSPDHSVSSAYARKMSVSQPMMPPPGYSVVVQSPSGGQPYARPYVMSPNGQILYPVMPYANQQSGPYTQNPDGTSPTHFVSYAAPHGMVPGAHPGHPQPSSASAPNQQRPHTMHPIPHQHAQIHPSSHPHTNPAPQQQQHQENPKEALARYLQGREAARDRERRISTQYDHSSRRASSQLSSSNQMIAPVGDRDRIGSVSSAYHSQSHHAPADISRRTSVVPMPSQPPLPHPPQPQSSSQPQATQQGSSSTWVPTKRKSAWMDIVMGNSEG